MTLSLIPVTFNNVNIFIDSNAEFYRSKLETLSTAISTHPALASYFDVPTGRFADDALGSDGKLDIEFRLISGTTTTFVEKSYDANNVPTIVINLNPTDIDGLSTYLGFDGKVHDITFNRAITHELVHIITGFDDAGLEDSTAIQNALATPNSDFIGDTVRLTNLVMAEKFSEIDRAHYPFGVDIEVLNNPLPDSNFVINDFTMGDNVTFDAVFTTSQFDNLATQNLINKIGNSVASVDPNSGELSTRETNDLIVTFDGQDTIFAGGGNDYIYSGQGPDLVYAGEGDDFINSGSGSGVDTLHGEGGDDRIIAGNGDDFIFGGDDDDTIEGQDGGDFIEGNDGRDHLIGGEGNDTLDGTLNGIEDDKDGDYLVGGDGDDTFYIGLSDDIGRSFLLGTRGSLTINMDLDKVVDVVNDQDKTGLIVFPELDVLQFPTGAIGRGQPPVYLGKVYDEWFPSIDGDVWLVIASPTDQDDLVPFREELHIFATFYTWFDDITGTQRSGLLLFSDRGETGEYQAIVILENFHDGDFGITSTNSPSDYFGTPNDDNFDGDDGDGDIDGNGGDDSLGGGGGNDNLNGGNGNDSLFGGTGNDNIIGGNGSDVINGGDGNDTVDYSDSGSGVIVNLATNSVSGGTANGDQISNIENITGSRFDDVLTGDSNDNTINGAGGTDTIDGGEGSDTLSYESLIENGAGGTGVTLDLLNGTVSGSGINGTTISSIENLTGTFSSDTLIGDNGDNVLNGLLDTGDTITGNGGNDIIYVDGSAELNRSDGGAGVDTVIYRHDNIGSITYTLGTNNYENFIIDSSSRNSFIRVNGDNEANRIEDQRENPSSPGDVEFKGFGGDDTLIGGFGNDTLDGGTGNDFIDGGAGRDRVLYGNNQGQFIVNLVVGTAVFANGEIDQLVNIEDITIRNGDNTFIGNHAANRIWIGNGNDNIFAGAGNDEVAIQFGGGTDTLNGESGIDTLVTTTSLGNATVNLLAGSFSSSDGSQANVFGFENVTTGNGDDLIIGSDVSNTLDGNGGTDQIFASGGDDIILHGEGDDLYDGGTGSDTVDYSEVGLGDNSGLFIDLVNGVVVNSSDNEQDNLVSIENVIGGYQDDYLSGNSADNTIDGFLGDDTIFGLDGNDILVGNGGADSLQGGNGDDTIIIDGDDIWYSGDAGIDTLIYIPRNGSVPVTDFNYALDQGGFENAEFGAGNDTIYGGESNNNISGGAGNDTLFGFGGDDTLIGGDGMDSLQGGDGNDRIVFDEDDIWWSGDSGIDTAVYVGSGNITYALDQGAFENAEFGSGNDTIYGGEVSNNIQGGAGDDTIFGYGGSDTIIGGSGNDSLFGGVGADVFVFSDNSGHDAVLDFENGLDVIDLSSHSQIVDFNDVINLASQVGSDVIIDFGNGSTIGLVNVDLTTEIDQSDFLFA